MPENPKFLLRRIIEVQNVYIQYKYPNGNDSGRTNTWIYNNVIEKNFNISFSTFNNYLRRNAKQELKDLETKTVKP